MKNTARWLGVCAAALALACSDKDETSGSGDLDVQDGSAEEAGTRRDAGADASDDERDADDDQRDADDDERDAGSDARDARDSAVASGDASNDPDCTGLKATIRDFKAEHADFEGPGNNSVNKGIVELNLGADRKPVYATTAPMISTSGADNFNQWYRDVPGVNQAFQIDIPLMQMGAGLFVYDNAMFFPIDGRGFGNEGNAHNYHFTTEIHTRFTYKGGEVFTFRGDDDLWAFVNGKLAIDLGGLHTPQMMTINFDQRAAELGLVVGETYPMDIFHAERHTVESNFRIETSIACFTPVDLL